MAIFEIHVHEHADLSKVLKELKKLHQKLSQMATKQDFQQALDTVTTALDNIAADITRLTDELATGGLTDAEETDVLNQLRAVADRARAIADTTPENSDPENPTPETPTA